jgi:hypothetical protein
MPTRQAQIEKVGGIEHALVHGVSIADVVEIIVGRA